MSAVQAKAAEISGVPDVSPVSESRVTGKTTAGFAVQKAAYQLSKAVFNFSPPTFELDTGLNSWSKHAERNAFGEVPQVFPLETRVGASMALLGYLGSSTAEGLTSVVAASGTVKVMEPVLARYLPEFQRSKVAFQVAAVDYDLAQGSLVTDDISVARVARNLGAPLFVSSLGLPDDATATAFLTSVVANSVGPAFHVFDGIRGTRQAITPAKTHSFDSIPSVSNLMEAFSVTNSTLGTSLAPFEYYGPKEPSVIYVTMGDPAVLATKSASVGVVNVRLYSPFLSDEFLRVLPATTTRLIVVGKTNDLYKDVSAAVRLHYGFKSGIMLQSIVTGFVDHPFVSHAEKGPVVKVWDSDKSATASSTAVLATPLSEANVFTKFDNLVAGGAVQTDLRLEFGGEFWEADAAEIVFVNDAKLLKSYDVTATARQGGVLVVAAASDDELAQVVPGQLKLNAYAKHLQIYRVDYSKIDTANTHGRTASMAAQAAIWLLMGSDVDTATARIVHANGRNTELVAATVNKIVTTLKEEALVRVSPEVINEWAKVELSDKEKDLQFTTSAAISSFVPVEKALVSADDEENAEPGALVDEVSSIGLKKRLVFKEAYHEHTELRPDVPTKTSIARVKLNQRVTPADYDRHIFQLELDIAGTGLTYGIGEALGIHAPNNSAEVLSFLEWYGVDPDEVVAVPVATEDGEGTKAYRTAYQHLRDNLDLFGKVPKRFFEALADYATDEKEKAHLQRLAGPEGAAELKARTEEDFENYADILKAFPSAKPSIAQLVDIVAPLKRREYSIASSQKVHPTEVHLLIVVVDWVNKKGERRFGQCSKFLADLQHGDEVVVSVKPSVMKLPKDPETPIIMAGLGTGLAPFKAFLEEKMWQRDQGHKIGSVYLFLGSRHQRQEYLYGELFEGYKSAGILTHIGAAFSRDQAEKIYIQHRIQQAQADLIDAFVEKEGNFYLCGPTWPVADISAALTEIVQAGAAINGTQVDTTRLIEDLKEQERYILEVY